jgi:hypothetical protein
MILCVSLVLLLPLASRTCGGEPPASAEKTEPRYLAGVEYLATLWQPHRWGVDFVKHGHYLLVTGSESQRTFVVVDVGDPRRMKVVAELEAGMYAARNLCRHGNLALVDYYRWINAMDLTNPAAPEFLAFATSAGPSGAGRRARAGRPWCSSRADIAWRSP